MQTKLVKELVGLAQGHLPTHGFNIDAIQAGAKQSGLASSSTVIDLFRNPSHTTRTLLEDFDQRHWDPYREEQRRRGLRGKEEQVKAFEDAVGLLESKLVATIPVRERLPDVSVGEAEGTNENM